ncbi:hypothetical protein L6452_36233 [Arctium lappa]|uniref:Uncharacterized protein n=1 Tax=Arctium lappa TaxID=4217 RepID=A0ACB8Y8N1_ARCLA|nr:hypothetical protein L6452_36233 [Arctium lappa]
MQYFRYQVCATADAIGLDDRCSYMSVLLPFLPLFGSMFSPQSIRGVSLLLFLVNAFTHNQAKLKNVDANLIPPRILLHSAMDGSLGAGQPNNNNNKNNNRREKLSRGSTLSYNSNSTYNPSRLEPSSASLKSSLASLKISISLPSPIPFPNG